MLDLLVRNVDVAVGVVHLSKSEVSGAGRERHSWWTCEEGREEDLKSMPFVVQKAGIYSVDWVQFECMPAGSHGMTGR